MDIPRAYRTWQFPARTALPRIRLRATSGSHCRGGFGTKPAGIVAARSDATGIPTTKPDRCAARSSAKASFASEKAALQPVRKAARKGGRTAKGIKRSPRASFSNLLNKLLSFSFPERSG